MFKGDIAKLLVKHVKLPENKIIELIEIPPDSNLGDYAFPCFVLIKELKKKPNEIAKDLESIKISGSIKKVKAVGPYLNFFIEESARAETVIEKINKNKFWEKTSKKKITIEYPGPNTNKPLHLGHVRNMLLGSTVKNILEKDGNKVISVNINNDRGIHICKSILAYKKWGKNKDPDKKSDHFVGDFYVLYGKNESEELEKEAQEMLRKWEDKDPETIKLWKKMNKWAFNGFKETYKRYNIKIDKEYYESDTYKKGKEIVKKNISKFKEEDGAIVAPLKKYNLPDKVVIRSDGTSVYITQDIALTMDRKKDFHPDLQIWVVASEQNLHFQHLFAILDMLGLKEDFRHLSYGMVFLPEGKMKSREGKVVDADNLLDEMEELAAKEIKKRNKWSEKKIKEVSKKVAMAAIRFFMLKFDPAKDFTFDPKTSLSFEGDTGPYLQYTHARISSILRKAKPKKADLKLLKEPEEQDLLRKISMLPLSLKRAARDYKPSIIANQILEIARSFNTFYHKCPVLKAEEDIKNARLELISATRKVIKESLELLGIEAPEEM